jgi:peptidyl-prolyl cis-trans isomerase C
MNPAIGRWAIRLTIITAFVLASFSAFGQETEPVIDPVALVNGVKITDKEYQRELNLHLQQAAQQGGQIPDLMLPKIKTDILNNLIDRELLYQESQKKNATIDAEEVNNQLKSIKDRFPSQAEFENTLGQLDLTEADVKSQLERNIAIRNLIDKTVTQKINVSDEETKAFYEANPNLFKQSEQVKASHILIKVDPGATDTQKAQARIEIVQIKQKLKNGQDFAAFAKEYSQGPSSVNGGDLGFFGRGQMVKPFEDAAFALKPNEVSDIVETRFGYHLIKVVDKKPGGMMTYAEVKDQIGRRLKRKKIEQEAKLYIENLKKDAKIEKYI